MKLPPLNYHKLNYWLTADIEKLFANSYHTADARFLFTKRKGAKILAVAHLDTVQSLTAPVYNQNKSTVHASGLDDRLGAYIASNWLIDNGIVCDVLLTDGEESASSTAQFFNKADEYNWIVEFDRTGEDAVTYDMDCPEWIDELKLAGFTMARGSFSDISFLKTNRCAVNIGVGYRNYHSKDAFADLIVLRRQLARFKNLYAKCKDTRFDQTKRALALSVHPQYDDWYGDAWPDGGSRFPNTSARRMDLGYGVNRLCEACDMMAPCTETMYGVYCDECIEYYGILKQ